MSERAGLARLYCEYVCSRRAFPEDDPAGFRAWLEPGARPADDDVQAVFADFARQYAGERPPAAEFAAAVDRTRRRRKKVAVRLRDALGDRDLAVRLERELWAWAAASSARDPNSARERYVTRALSLAFNLRNPRNPRLLERVRSGDVSPERLVRMSPEDMFPELYAEARHRLASKALARMARDARDAPDGPEAHRCGRCKSLKTQYYSMQTRSADEPMTVFFSCLECGKRWKQ